MFGARPEKAEEPRDLFARARALYEKEDRRLVPVSLHARITPEAPARLTVSDSDGHTVTVTGDVPQAARTRSLTAEEAEARLQKTGGTAFTPAACTAEVAEGLSLSAASLNALRRRGLEALAEIRVRPPLRREGGIPAAAGDRGPAAPPDLTVSLMDPGQLTAELMAFAPAVCPSPSTGWRRRTSPPGGGAIPCSPWSCPGSGGTGTSPGCAGNSWRAGSAAFPPSRSTTSATSPAGGHPSCAPGGLRAEYLQRNAVEFLREQGLGSATLSFELRLEQIRDMAKPLPCEALVYGRLPLMITENCLVRNRWGCRSRDLRGPCRWPHLLRDRRGEEFPVCPAFGCRSEVENSQVLFLADKPDYRQLGLRWARLRFTTESPGQCAAVLSRYAGQGDWQPETSPGDFFTGAWNSLGREEGNGRKQSKTLSLPPAGAVWFLLPVHGAVRLCALRRPGAGL